MPSRTSDRKMRNAGPAAAASTAAVATASPVVEKANGGVPGGDGGWSRPR